MMIQIATDEILQLYKNLKTQVPNKDFFIADSERVVLKLLESSLEIDSLLATPEWYQHHLLTQIPQINRIKFFSAPKEILKEIVGFSLHQGVMARGKVPSDALLSELSKYHLIILDGVTKAENVGAIIRSGISFGFRHFLVSPETPHPYHRRAVRTSMGNVFFSKVRRAIAWEEELMDLKKFGIKLVGLENIPQAIPLTQFQVDSPFALIFGSEGYGLRPETLSLLDHIVKIPLSTEADSLNVSSACAIVCYELSQKYLRT